jgi:hypothetical protein
LSSFLQSPARLDGYPLVDSVVITVAPMFIGDGVGVVPKVSSMSQIMGSKAHIARRTNLGYQNWRRSIQRLWAKTQSWSAPYPRETSRASRSQEIEEVPYAYHRIIIIVRKHHHRQEQALNTTNQSEISILDTKTGSYIRKWTSLSISSVTSHRADHSHWQGEEAAQLRPSC